jgi:hypothetical protein
MESHKIHVPNHHPVTIGFDIVDIVGMVDVVDKIQLTAIVNKWGNHL